MGPQVLVHVSISQGTHFGVTLPTINMEPEVRRAWTVFHLKGPGSERQGGIAKRVSALVWGLTAMALVGYNQRTLLRMDEILHYFETMKP